MRLRRLLVEAVVTGAVLTVVGCSDEPSTQPRTGRISVQVVDMSSNQPLAGVEIAVPEANQTAKTDANGIAVFEVNVGSHFVDARLCCIGPGFIEEHVSVSVTPGKTVDVTLYACTACV